MWLDAGSLNTIHGDWSSGFPAVQPAADVLPRLTAFNPYGHDNFVAGKTYHASAPAYGQPFQHVPRYPLPAQGHIQSPGSGPHPYTIPHQRGPFMHFHPDTQNHGSPGGWTTDYRRPSASYPPVGDLASLQISYPKATSASYGPPLKPKRSGHALWVGNLHPTTSIIALRDHFSQGATNDIESVFFIARSTCAFVNYKSEDACRSALARFHGSRLQANSLVCRIRRDSTVGNGVMSSNSSNGSPTDTVSTSSITSRDAEQAPTTPVIVGVQSTSSSTPIIAPDNTPETEPPRVAEKFFVLKSLTMQDLETSIEQQSWMTQPHNEEVLDKAFREAKTVYLIFSANRSREYFGFARMTSSISSEAMSSPINRSQAPEKGPQGWPLKCTYTPATSSAPKGRIVDDSARGTLFWEACPPDADDSSGDDSPASKGQEDVQATGKTFSIEWLCVRKLPFFRTRGLRNPWNANREVKIARDGTEIEPRIGRRLLALFAGGGEDMATQFM